MIVAWGDCEIFRFWELNVVGKSKPIMLQLTVVGVLGCHLRLHRFYDGDEEHVFHTHPRHFVSLCVAGE